MAGVAFTAITMGFAFEIFSDPLVALAPLMLILIAYGSATRLPYRIPGSLGALLFGGVLFTATKLLGFVNHGDGNDDATKGGSDDGGGGGGGAEEGSGLGVQNGLPWSPSSDWLFWRSDASDASSYSAYSSNASSFDFSDASSSSSSSPSSSLVGIVEMLWARAMELMGSAQLPAFHPPQLCLDLLWAGWASGRGWRYMSVIIPVTVVNISSNLAQVESAWGVGDRFS